MAPRKKCLYQFCLLSVVSAMILGPGILEGGGAASLQVMAGEAERPGDGEGSPLDGADFIEERVYRRDGLVITIRMMAEDREGVDFEIDGENLNAAPRTLRGRLCLYDLRVRDRDCGSGEGNVRMELPAKSKETRKEYRVRKKSFYEAWTFVIDKIHDY